jgi:RepB plasmid partitioning protein/ParB-like nuclease family protein
MTRKSLVKMGFEQKSVRLAVADIRPLRIVTPAAKRGQKYSQISASVAEVGIIEPLVVARDPTASGKYMLLDGHLRLEAIKDAGASDVVCLISTDDEAFTYNRHVNRLATVQEHKMILRAVERGASEARIANALKVNTASLKRKMKLLDGICPEAAEVLKDKHVPMNTFVALRRMAPLRQIEAAELMAAMNTYTASYADSLLAATPPAQLAETGRVKRPKGITDEQLALMERESASLDRELKVAEQSYASDHLDLVLAMGFLGKLLGNKRIERYLHQRPHDIVVELRKLVHAEATTAA